MEVEIPHVHSEVVLQIIYISEQRYSVPNVGNSLSGFLYDKIKHWLTHDCLCEQTLYADLLFLLTIIRKRHY